MTADALLASTHAARCPVTTGDARCDHGCRCPDVAVSQRRGESAADCCRRNGWGPGTLLEGCEGYGTTRIVITAVGERAILARAISHRGEPSRGRHENSWTLSCRDWQPVSEAGEQP